MDCLYFLKTMIVLFTATQTTVGQPVRRIEAYKPGAFFRNSVDGYLKPLGHRRENSRRPSYIRQATLWSKMGFHLAILENGTVQGVNESYCIHTGRCVFELQSFGTSLIRIKNVKSDRYLAISEPGKVFTTKKMHTKGTLMHQKMLPSHFTIFWSQKHRRKGRKLFLALKKNGDVKNASKPKEYHKSTHFVIYWIPAIKPA